MKTTPQQTRQLKSQVSLVLVLSAVLCALASVAARVKAAPTQQPTGSGNTATSLPRFVVKPAATEQGATEQSWLRAWVGAALFSRAVNRPAQTGLELRRQDYARLSLRQSVLNTPLQIGAQRYRHGLGTHANSEIQVRLPQPAQSFAAEVGVDNNHDTAGKRGSVVFAVEVGGQEVYRSGACRGGAAAVPVRLALPNSKEFTLRVFDNGDGPDYDQADWAQASVMINGKRLFLDELPIVAAPADFAPEIPFSFLYGGQSSATLLPTWQRTHREETAANGRQRHTITYTDPASGLEVRCEATVFAAHPAIEWVLSFRNTGAADAPLLEAIRPLDLRLQAPAGEVMLHRAHGSTSAATDFLPIDESVAPNARLHFAPSGGRSSDGALPFFNLAWNGGGLAGAVGWSGQWAMQVERNGDRQLTLRAGQQTTRLKLHPGESIRTPRVLLVNWHGGDRMRGHNLLRRLLLAQYVPRHNGQIAVPPVTQNTWFTFNSGNDVTEANQLQAIEAMAPLGVEAYWLDAGWFEGGWPSGVGSWVPRAGAFPRGLKPLGDAAHKKGMKFVLWFEPERVSPGSRIAREHPAWVLHQGNGDGLFNLGDAAARRWLTDLLSRRISEWGVDIFRNDFNIDPLRFWQAADSPDRQGMTEIRYIEGLYALWDELLQRHPGLVIDNCASGGRRIDLEMLSRSIPLWRSDTPVGGKAMPVWDQVQTAGLSLFVPLHASGLWGFDPYTRRSVATTGASISLNTMTEGFSTRQARRGIAEIKALRPLYLGDYYPLLNINLDERQWSAWQFDRPELGRGFGMFFRRSGSPYASIEAGFRGLDANAIYEVSLADAGTTQRMSGAKLSRLTIAIASAPGSALITYRRLAP